MITVRQFVPSGKITKLLALNLSERYVKDRVGRIYNKPVTTIP
jgi:hypothetical protein